MTMTPEELASFVARIDTTLEYIKKSMDKKANGWVETVMKGTIGTILLSVIGALLALVIGGGATLIASNIITAITYLS